MIDKIKDMYLTIFERPLHNQEDISFHGRFQCNYICYSYQMLYMKANSVQCFGHLSIFDLFPCYSCLELADLFLRVNQMLSENMKNFKLKISYTT